MNLNVSFIGLLVLSIGFLPAAAKPMNVAVFSEDTIGENNTMVSSEGNVNHSSHNYALENMTWFSVKNMMKSRAPLQAYLGISKQGRPIRAFYFPGTSDKKAVVIGGVHGSELSSIDV